MQNSVTPQYTFMLILPLHCFLSVESGCSGGRGGKQGGKRGVRGQQYPEENVHKAVVMNIHLWRRLGPWRALLAERSRGWGNIKAHGRSHYPMLRGLNVIQPVVCVLLRHSVLPDLIQSFICQPCHILKTKIHVSWSHTSPTQTADVRNPYLCGFTYIIWQNLKGLLCLCKFLVWCI